MDGLVSTGIGIPYTILKIIFANRKKNYNYFINILICLVDKAGIFLSVFKALKDHSLLKSASLKNAGPMKALILQVFCKRAIFLLKQYLKGFNFIFVVTDEY